LDTSSLIALIFVMYLSFVVVIIRDSVFDIMTV